MRDAKVLYIVAADPGGDDPLGVETGHFLVVQDLFLTATAKLADVVLPAQAFTERWRVRTPPASGAFSAFIPPFPSDRSQGGFSRSLPRSASAWCKAGRAHPAK